MKTHSFLLLAFFSILLWSCDGMYDNVNTYYNEGETNYIAKADSVSTKAGHNRVQFTWKVNTDPRIKNLNVTWDDGAKEVTIPIEFSSLDELCIFFRQDREELEEKLAAIDYTYDPALNRFV